jgi:hypothetical protein
MLQIVSNVVLIAAIAYLTFLYQKVLAPFSEKYSEEKGRRLATHEDFEEILRKQRRMTNEIERIKSQVLDEVWLWQTIWREKRDIYASLIESTDKLHGIAIALSLDALKDAAYREVQEAAGRFTTIEAKAKIFLSDPMALAALTDYQDTLEGVDVENPHRHPQIWIRLRDALVEAARRELCVAPSGIVISK